MYDELPSVARVQIVMEDAKCKANVEMERVVRTAKSSGGPCHEMTLSS